MCIFYSNNLESLLIEITCGYSNNILKLLTQKILLDKAMEQWFSN